MSYIFSSNGNNYTFKKLDNMLINIPEKDGHHVLIRETVDGVPQYSWGSASCIVKVNEAFVFEYTPEATESFNGEWGGDGMPPMPSGSYLVTMTVITYLPDDMFNDCDSIESVVEKGYRVLVTFDNTPILDRPYIDTLNSLVSHTGYAVVNVGTSPVLRTHHDRFLTLGRGCCFFFWLLVMDRCDLTASLNALGSFRLLHRVTGGAGCCLHLLASSSQ